MTLINFIRNKKFRKKKIRTLLINPLNLFLNFKVFINFVFSTRNNEPQTLVYINRNYNSESRNETCVEKKNLCLEIRIKV